MRSLATLRIVCFYVFKELVSLHQAGRSAPHPHPPTPLTCHDWTLRKVSWPSVSLITICISSLFMNKVNLESAAHFPSIHISYYSAGFVRAETVSIGSVVDVRVWACEAVSSIWVYQWKSLQEGVFLVSYVKVRVKHLSGTQRTTVIIETSMNHTWSSRQVTSGSSISPHRMTEKKQLQLESSAHKFKNQKITSHY